MLPTFRVRILKVVMQGSEAWVTAFILGCIQNIDVDEINVDGNLNKKSLVGFLICSIELRGSMGSLGFQNEFFSLP